MTPVGRVAPAARVARVAPAARVGSIDLRHPAGLTDPVGPMDRVGAPAVPRAKAGAAAAEGT
jgi:hypothetical protein